MGVSAIIGGIGTVAQIAGSVSSFAQARKQKELAKEADIELEKAMARQSDLLETNFAEQVQVPLEGYELAAQTNAAIQGQAMDALTQSGDRALIGGVGRVAAQGNRAAEANRMNMQSEMYRRNQLIAAEDDRIRNAKRDVELAKVSGAQRAKAQAEVRRQQLLSQGISGLGNAAATGLSSAGLYTGGGMGLNTPEQPSQGLVYPEINYYDQWNPGGVTPTQTINNNPDPNGTQADWNVTPGYLWDQNLGI